MLAVFVGYYVVWSVTPALHTPLMSVTNAISSVIIVGALIAAGPAGLHLSKVLGFVAITLASVNIFGGFIVTQRMLPCSRRRSGSNHVREPLRARLPDRRGLFILALRGLSPRSRRARATSSAWSAWPSPSSPRWRARASLSLPAIVVAILIGGAIGAVIARRIQMTAMPQLVAAFHCLVGMAAVLVAAAAFYNPAAYGIVEPRA